MNRYLSWSVFFISGFLAPVSAQDTLPKAYIQLGYGYQQTVFDLNDRYGGHGVLEGGLIFQKKHWVYGLRFQYLFGNKVKEDVLAGFRSIGGELIGEDHQIAQVDLRMRGSVLGISLGNSFKISRSASLVAEIQPGWMVHWIRFQNPGQTFGPIRGEYRYGYDRLSSGFALAEQLSYRYLSYNRLINFELGIRFTQGFTKLRRNIQLDQTQVSPEQRLDGLIGFEAKWILPIYRKKNPESIYY